MADLAVGLRGLMGLWAERWSARQRLGSLDARMLRDVGLDPDIAAREAAKPFWRA